MSRGGPSDVIGTCENIRNTNLPIILEKEELKKTNLMMSCDSPGRSVAELQPKIRKLPQKDNPFRITCFNIYILFSFFSRGDALA